MGDAPGNGSQGAVVGMCRYDRHAAVRGRTLSVVFLGQQVAGQLMSYSRGDLSTAGSGSWGGVNTPQRSHTEVWHRYGVI